MNTFTKSLVFLSFIAYCNNSSAAKLGEDDTFKDVAKTIAIHVIQNVKIIGEAGKSGHVIGKSGESGIVGGDGGWGWWSGGSGGTGILIPGRGGRGVFFDGADGKAACVVM